MDCAKTMALICAFVFAHIKTMMDSIVCLFEALRPAQQFFSHFGTASWV